MSGIYIKGMEMPTGCETCYFHRWVDIGVGACAGCELLKTLMNDDRDRLPDCPLIHVPDHGRLIDADALIAKITDAAKEQPEIADVYYEEATEIGGWLYSMPTIIPASGGTENE